MPNMPKLSTVFLLIIVGLLIYLFAKPQECFAETPMVPSTNDVNAALQQAAATQAAAQQAAAVASVQPLASSVPVQPLTPAAPVAIPEQKGDAVPTKTFDYEANDDSGELGASLDVAFERPLPPQVNPNTVDLNKNNVKQYDAKDYLPKELNDKWFDTDFSQAKYNLNDDKLINTERYVIGINTVGQSLKNASYDIRGTVPNPKFTVSPWNNSTYEPDYNIKPMC